MLDEDDQFCQKDFTDRFGAKVSLEVTHLPPYKSQLGTNSMENHGFILMECGDSDLWRLISFYQVKNRGVYEHNVNKNRKSLVWPETSDLFVSDEKTSFF